MEPRWSPANMKRSAGTIGNNVRSEDDIVVGENRMTIFSSEDVLHVVAAKVDSVLSFLLAPADVVVTPRSRR